MAPKVKDKVVLVVDKNTCCMNDNGNLHKEDKFHLGQEQVLESMHELIDEDNGSAQDSAELELLDAKDVLKKVKCDPQEVWPSARLMDHYKKILSSSRHSSEEGSAARYTEEQKRKIEEYPPTQAILEMVGALAGQERSDRAEQVGNHFAADAAKEWTCSTCTRINKATDNACASCDKANLVGVGDDPITLHDIQVAKNRSNMKRKKKPKGSKGIFWGLSLEECT